MHNDDADTFWLVPFNVLIVLLDMPDSSSAPAPAIKPTTISSSRDTERYFCHWGECNVQTGQLAELIQHIRHVHVGSGKVRKTKIIGITPKDGGSSTRDTWAK